VVVAVSILALTLVLGVADSGQPQPPTPMQVWISPDASLEQIARIHNLVYTAPGIKDCAFWSRQHDFRQALRLLPRDVSNVLSPSNTPSSFRCEFVTLSAYENVATRLDAMPGIYEVTFGAGFGRNLSPSSSRLRTITFTTKGDSLRPSFVVCERRCTLGRVHR
jgi:cell division protein FtsX